MKIMTVAGCMAALALAASSCKIITYRGEDFSLNYGETNKVEVTGEVVTRNYDCGEFYGLDISAIVDVVYTQGPCSVSVETHEDVFDYLKIYVNDDGNLNVSTDDWINFDGLEKLVVWVSSPNLSEINVAGAADIEFPEPVDLGDVDVTVSGAASLKAMAPVKMEDFTVSMSGAGEVNFDHGLEAWDVEIGISGAGKCSVKDLDCDKFDFHSSGAGKCTVTGTAHTASLSVSGAGTIDATGLDCSNVSSRVSGAGTIKTN